MNPIDKIAEELLHSPKRFHATDGYERLLKALEQGHPSGALGGVLEHQPGLAGDLLRTIAELEKVDDFVPIALRFLAHPDKGTTAYAVEIVLRGAHQTAELRAVFDRLRSSDLAVCEHAVRVLSGEGASRLWDILKALGGEWSEGLVRLRPDELSRSAVEDLIRESSRDRQVVGVVLATLALEQDASYAAAFECAGEAWIREYGEWLLQEP